MLALLAHVFNKIVCERFSTSWRENIIELVFKSGDPIMSSNYTTITTVHYLAKLDGLILELELSI